MQQKELQIFFVGKTSAVMAQSQTGEEKRNQLGKLMVTGRIFCLRLLYRQEILITIHGLFGFQI